MKENKTLQFPDGFLWGAGTSSHQVEGGQHNDWTEWEEKNADRLAAEAKNYWSGWQKEKFPEMFERKNYISGQAIDFYDRYQSDFDLVKELNHNAHRFSLEWSRIEPREGEFDQAVIDHYRKMVKNSQEKGIEPMVTIWHWPLPLWLRDQGGWANKNIIKYFSRYAEKVAAGIPEVNLWLTLNEPEIYAMNGYLRGVWPPQKKCPLKYFKVLRNLARAHNLSFEKIKKIDPKKQIGIAKHNTYFEAYKNRIVNRVIKKIADWWWNEYFLNQIKNHQDFIGLNYYFHNLIDYGLNKNKNKQVADMGWEIYPEGIYHVLKDLKKYKKPIYITENGLADKADQQRQEFIIEHLRWIHKAIQAGVLVRGYFHWSMFDNFEWDKGFWPRFGLVEIDYKTQKRKIRPSARVYADICTRNQLKI